MPPAAKRKLAAFVYPLHVHKAAARHSLQVYERLCRVCQLGVSAAGSQGCGDRGAEDEGGPSAGEAADVTVAGE